MAVFAFSADMKFRDIKTSTFSLLCNLFPLIIARLTLTNKIHNSQASLHNVYPIFVYFHHHGTCSLYFYEVLGKTIKGIDLLYYVNKHTSIFQSIYSSVGIAEFSFAYYYYYSKCRHCLAAGLIM